MRKRREGRSSGRLRGKKRLSEKGDLDDERDGDGQKGESEGELIRNSRQERTVNIPSEMLPVNFAMD